MTELQEYHVKTACTQQLMQLKIIVGNNDQTSWAKRYQVFKMKHSFWTLNLLQKQKILYEQIQFKIMSVNQFVSSVQW